MARTTLHRSTIRRRGNVLPAGVALVVFAEAKFMATGADDAPAIAGVSAWRRDLDRVVPLAVAAPLNIEVHTLLRGAAGS
ncbi:MAG: hypothetical protein QME96_14615 [Myxococcota bacterium]|nr:hypothetical protein [Myxococcota bacterium]